MGGPDWPKNINYKLVEIHGVACEMFKSGVIIRFSSFSYTFNKTFKL